MVALLTGSTDEAIIARVEAIHAELAACDTPQAHMAISQDLAATDRAAQATRVQDIVNAARALGHDILPGARPRTVSSTPDMVLLAARRTAFVSIDGAVKVCAATRTRVRGGKVQIFAADAPAAEVAKYLTWGQG